MERLLKLTILIMIVLLATGLAFAQGVGQSTPTDGDGNPADDPDCDDPTDPQCGNGIGGSGGTGGGYSHCSQQTTGQGHHAAFDDWGWCMEQNFALLPWMWAQYLYSAEGYAALVIGMVDGSDLDSICAYDNVDGIQGWDLYLDGDGYIAKYKELEMPQTAGEIYFEINGVATPVLYADPGSRFATYHDKPSFNQMIRNELVAAGYTVEVNGEYVTVDYDSPFFPGVQTFTMRLTGGTDLTDLALAIEPYNTWTELDCRRD